MRFESGRKLKVKTLFVKYKAGFFILIGILVFFLAIISASLYIDYKESVRQSRIMAKNNSFSLDQYIQSVFNKIDLSLISVSRELNPNEVNNKKIAHSHLDILDEYRSKLPEVHAFRIADGDGKVVVNTDRSVASNMSIDDREYFQFHKNNSDSGLFISKPIKSKFDGKMVITLSRRIPSKNKNFEGIIYAAVTLDYFHQFISTIDVGKSGNITFVSLNEQIVLYRFPPVANTLGQKLKLTTETLTLISSQQVSGEWEQVSTIDGKKKTFAARVNHSLNYLVFTGLAEDDYLQRWRFNLFSRCLVFFIFSLVLLVGFVKYVFTQEEVEMQKNQIHENARRIAITRISNGVAHEINNPLAIIKGKNEVAKMLVEGDASKAEILKALEGIDLMVARAAKIVKGLGFLDHKKNEQIGVFRLSSIFDSSIAILAQKIADSSIGISVETIPNIEIKADRGRLTEVFIHLLSNSIDAIQNKSEKWIKISFEVRAQQICVMFTDSGQGIPETNVRQLTDPFFSTKEIGSGAGLGLSVSDSIMRALGGSLSYNANSKNTQFIVIFNIENRLQIAS